VHLLQVAAWLKTLPSAKSPLVAMTAQQASDAAVDRLQMQLPGLLPVGTGAMGECGTQGCDSCCIGYRYTLDTEQCLVLRFAGACSTK
jgi:hypothetical protein